jgi:hypothetical protein
MRFKGAESRSHHKKRVGRCVHFNAYRKLNILIGVFRRCEKKMRGVKR